jgi:hypothetical protein
MRDGDILQVHWQGYDESDVAGPEYESPQHVVSLGEASLGQVRLVVPAAQLTPYLNGRVVVSYTQVPYGSSDAATSAEAGYTVGAQNSGLRITAVTNLNNIDMLTVVPTLLFEDAAFTLTLEDDEPGRIYEWTTNSPDITAYGTGLTGTVNVGSIDELTNKDSFEYIVTATDVTRQRSAAYHFTASYGLRFHPNGITNPGTKLPASAATASDFTRLFREWGDYKVYVDSSPYYWLGGGYAGVGRWYIFNAHTGAVTAESTNASHSFATLE